MAQSVVPYIIVRPPNYPSPFGSFLSDRQTASQCHALPLRVMKTSYILGAIVLCSIVGAMSAGRGTKTALLVVSGLLAAYGLFRILG